jgi:hypothetical protein
LYDKSLVNVTTVCSYSALSKKVYISNYYEDDMKIPVISGYVERMIREAYIGGIVDVVEHIVVNGFKYDSNSHYPAAMLNDMPTGRPRLTDNKNLDELFGFSYVKVTAPDEKRLRVAILPIHDENGQVVCPRGQFHGIFFTEELKNAKKYGYKVEVLYSVIFNRGVGLFNRFVEDLYKQKAEARAIGDPVQDLIAKLLMNSLYGKTGQNEIMYKFE